MKPTPGHIWRQLPPEAWLSDGRQVLHFRSSRWDRWCQQKTLLQPHWHHHPKQGG